MFRRSTLSGEGRGSLRVPVLVLVAMFLAAAGIVMLDPEGKMSLVSEGGLVETGTVVFYALAVIVCLWMWMARLWPDGWAGAVILGLMMAREMDVHKEFTEEHITSTRYWRSADAAISEKLIVALLLLAAGVVLVAAARRTWAPFRERLKRREAPAMMVAWMAVFVVLSQIPDRTIDTAHLEGKLDFFLLALEETLEMGVALCALIAAAQWWRCLPGRKRSESAV